MSMHPTTSRLVLRAPMLTDMAQAVALLDDYEVAKNLVSVPHPFGEDDFRDLLYASVRDRGARMGFDFAVTRALDGDLIGFCSVASEAPGEWALHYWYGRRYWGQGYATEAAWPVLRYAFERLGLDALSGGWFADNPASGAVLRKLGFEATHRESIVSLARGVEVQANRMQLTREQYVRKKAA